MRSLRAKLLLWDLDGVIVDSEPVHEEVRRRLTLEMSRGRDLDLGYDPTGTDTVELFRVLLEKAGINDNPEAWAQKQYRCVVEELLRRGQPLISGVEETLEYCVERNIACAVVSSSYRFYVEELLSRYGIRKYMRTVVCDDRDLPLKPAPDLYLRALNSCETLAADAVALEDSLPGLAAAAAAGIRCIAYRPKGRPPQANIPRADWMVGSIGDVSTILRPMESERNQDGCGRREPGQGSASK